jgi:putative transposase
VPTAAPGVFVRPHKRGQTPFSTPSRAAQWGTSPETHQNKGVRHLYFGSLALPHDLPGSRSTFNCMSRMPRASRGGEIYHVLNRACRRDRVFHTPSDYAAFMSIVRSAMEHCPMRLLAWCVMPNHWHFILWPRNDGDLSKFIRWITLTHTQRLHVFRETTGTGPIYQGRFKSFLIQDNDYLLTACRYVERNALRAKLVRKAEHWSWGSLRHHDRRGTPDAQLLSECPVNRPRNWVAFVNRPQTTAELQAVRKSVHRSRPFGNPVWADSVAEAHGLETSLRPRGRPKKGV